MRDSETPEFKALDKAVRDYAKLHAPNHYVSEWVVSGGAVATDDEETPMNFFIKSEDSAAWRIIGLLHSALMAFESMLRE